MVLVAATALVWLIGLGCWIQVVRGRGLLLKFRHLIAASVVTIIGILLGACLVILHAFQMFSGETLVARVTSRRISPMQFELTYVPAGPHTKRASAFGVGADGGSELERRVLLEGDQWSVSGGIVKWHPWLTFVGLPSYHKPMRLSGQFSDVAQQRAHLPTVEELSPELDRFWEALYWADPYLPFIEAVYGSAAYAYMEPGVVQEVYVTPSGYLIKRGPRL